jgi:hypothetical protein
MSTIVSACYLAMAPSFSPAVAPPPGSAERVDCATVLDPILALDSGIGQIEITQCGGPRAVLPFWSEAEHRVQQ